jgi:hypothetical protein
LDVETKVDLVAVAWHAAERWRAGYQNIAELLEKERISDTPEPSHKELIGTYVHSTHSVFF